ncbi:cell division protein CrgA [Arcanobacterium canis]|uniref:Cell division protein CrgA n=1 Tax=Arcanobacterium canis TaxID=999183 RepID=A0ABY8G0T8_9ACTO|nr:cell division protein CrgA [Arcanobacterium canis]WFM83413.1 cell division protein CrgA [Arcanobacterium canis]
MPESKKRKETIEHEKVAARRSAKEPKMKDVSPRWWVPTMLVFAFIGLIFVVTAYVTHGQYPIPGLPNGNINLFIGIGSMLIGFLMTMGWK